MSLDGAVVRKTIDTRATAIRKLTGFFPALSGITRKTVTRQGGNTEFAAKSSHTPYVGIRGVPVGEATMASVLADHLLRHRDQIG